MEGYTFMPSSMTVSGPSGNVDFVVCWETVGGAGFSPGEVWDVSLELAGDGTPYVAFRDGENGQKATVMRYSGGVWEIVGDAGFSAGMATYVSLALDSGGTPYVAYRDAENSGRVTVMRLGGAGWEAVGDAGLSAGRRITSRWRSTVAVRPMWPTGTGSRLLILEPR